MSKQINSKKCFQQENLFDLEFGAWIFMQVSVEKFMMSYLLQNTCLNANICKSLRRQDFAQKKEVITRPKEWPPPPPLPKVTLKVASVFASNCGFFVSRYSLLHFSKCTPQTTPKKQLSTCSALLPTTGIYIIKLGFTTTHL